MSLDHRQYYDSKYSKGPQGFSSAFPRQMRFLLRWAGLPSSPLRVLDLGGGTGEYSLMLQKMGHDVTLLELSPVAVDSARRLGVRRALCADFLTDTPTGKFDVVLVKGFSPLNTDDASAFKALIRRMNDMLSPHGSILYWGVTDLSSVWSDSGWFNWKADDFRSFFDDFLVFPALRYQARLPVWLNRRLSEAICRRPNLPRSFTVVALKRAVAKDPG